MTWYLSTQIYTMPSVIDLQSETSSTYSSDQFISQNDFVFPQSLDHQDSLSGRYSVSSFPYLPSGSEVPGYCQQQYTANVPNQHQCYRDNSFVWIGTNNFYPSSSYDQRYLEDSYNPQRQSHRRHNNSERTEKANSRKRRAPTVAQRRAANIRERRRMYNLNEAFDCLRQRIPTFAYEKRLSRIETLRLAISYISFMARIVNGEDPSTLRVNTYESPACSSTSLAQPGPRSSNTISTSFGCDNDDCEEDNVEDEEDEEDDVHGDDDDGDDDDGVGDSGQDSLLYTNGDSGNKT